MILFPSPSCFTPLQEHKRNLRRFFTSIDRRDHLFCWEPRGDWQDRDVRQICRDLDLIHCVDPFARPVRGRVRYLRLHGRPGYNLRFHYSNQDLQQPRTIIDRKEAYVLFNNLTIPHDAHGFRRIIGRP